MRLVVNGVERSVDAPEDMPLLWVLRDLLGIKGPKYGCGVGACGACTVLVDGKPVRSCALAAADAAGMITTIEGIGSTEALHPVQRVWLEEGVAQCGYCQPGQILAAIALLSADPDPSEAAIEAAMSNLCRCGTYPRIRAAIRAAARELRA